MTDIIAPEELARIFAEIGEIVANADYTEVMESFMPIFAADESRAFAHEMTVEGEPWAPLKPSTVARKGNDRILVEHGALIASLVNVGGPHNIHEAMPRGAIFGTSDPKALFHQLGTSRMPARPPVGISEETLDRLCEAVADRTVELIGAGHGR